MKIFFIHLVINYTIISIIYFIILYFKFYNWFFNSINYLQQKVIYDKIIFLWTYML